jgi:two-component system sensor histidine kinase NreB
LRNGLISSAVSELDFLVWELRPAQIDEFGLSKALTGFIEDWSHHFGIKEEHRIHEVRLTPEGQTCVYRIVQEALNNISKDASAFGAEARIRRNRLGRSSP